jgi:hypothetical protein
MEKNDASNIVSSRVRLSRNWEEYKFPSRLEPDEARTMIARLKQNFRDLGDRDGQFYEYEDLEEHARLHRDLVERAGTFHQATVTNQLSTGQLIDFIIDDLVKGHMFKQDRKFYHLFKK